MQPDTVVQLGTFAFADTEVPERIPFGGKQALVVHELVGGVRVVDAMGAFDADMEWSGIFVGSDAVSRARQLDEIRRLGAAVTLQWSEFNFQVVVQTFAADFERFYQVPYRISCVVVSDQGGDAPIAEASNLDNQLRTDLGTSNTLSASIGNPLLTSTMSTLSSAIGAVSDFAKATQSTINGVLQPLAAVQSQVTTLIASVANVAGNVTTLGGIAPGNPIAQQAASLSSQAAAFTSMPQLYALKSTLGRMSTNLASANTTGQTVSTAGGDLQQIAAQQFGDATAWPLIAQANGLNDPKVQGLQTLVIPPAPSNSQPVGGVLSG
ncbi:MAG: hypothetical protein KGL17_06245 [Betaproteobacteria bacterium]|nr:hypothetical protein [Betaproteobacteria bacterium]